MENTAEYGIVFVTVASLQQGEAIARTLLNEKLAACVNIFPIDSWYRWEGKIESGKEYQLIIKSDLNSFDSLADKIKRLHDYEVPEIIAIPIVAGSKSYLNWLGTSLQ